MPRLFVRYLDNSNLYTCRKCSTHLSSKSQEVFRSKLPCSSASVFFSKVVNIRQQPRTKKTKTLCGECTLADIYCNVCYHNFINFAEDQDSELEPIGWRYIQVPEGPQKYKEGKYIVQGQYLCKQQWSN